MKVSLDANGREVWQFPQMDRRAQADQQIVVGLRFWRGLSLEEIADRLQLPLGTVKSRLHYAMRTLRMEMDREAGEVRR